LQLRITGPAVESVLRTYQERADHHNAPVAIPPVTVQSPQLQPGELPPTHLVQIARTYYQSANLPGPFSFAPNGESTPTRSILAAIKQAKDFIYIEDQYFTPSDSYMHELLDAAARGVRALMITMPFATDQPYGSVRRAQILAALTTAWGDRIHLGAPLRRFLHEVPGMTTNLGRLALTAPLDDSAAVASFGPPGRVPPPPYWAFIGNELVLVHALFGAATPTSQGVEIVRAPGAGGWGAQPVVHPQDTPVLAVQLPGIYVHAKMMIVDDIFLFAGSSNVNRRSHYHDGELNSFTIPQHLMGDARNPARLLRARLMAEHLGLTTEMGQALFADPHSAFRYFKDRSWYEQSRWRGLDFFGSVPPDVPIGTAGSIPMFLLQVLIGGSREAAKPDVWPLLADPTSALDPSPHSRGPDYP
jgi:phosphatidylserine/phosphatidylglycerophosphate/cardiolipin synthase-like enzyme